MKLSDLPPETIERIKQVRYDRFLEKHEGPFDWEGELKWGTPDFMTIEGRDVLLPIDQDQHPNISVLRAIPSSDGNTLTLFLKDTTWLEGDDPFYQMLAGRVAICDKLPGEDFFLAVFYHEWYVC
jgi:hypothetical protein